MTTATPTFTAPGPGPWELETAHFPRPFPKFGLEGLMRGFKAGFAEGTARYGLLLSHFEPAIVNGFWYQQPVAFGAPKGAMGPPPRPVLWLLTRLHPAMRARIAACQTAFESKRWRADLTEWDEVDKPAALAKHRSLLAVDPAALDDAALARHAADCEGHLEAMLFLHHKYTIACCAPVGDLMVQVADWTGKDPGEVLALLRGSSPISLGFSARELESVRAAVAADPEAARILQSGDGARGTLDALAAHPGPAGEATRALVALVEHRAVAVSPADPSCGELPDVIVKAVRSAVDGRFEQRRSELEAATKTLREAVPAAHREAFDALLAEARLVNRLRDERGMYSDCWAVGIIRRAAREVGRRLAPRGLLEAPDHALDLSVAEAARLLQGGAGPTAAEVAERVRWRVSKSVDDCPPYLNGKPGDPPDPSVLPAPARRATRAIGTMISHLFAESQRASTPAVVRGISVNAGSYEGVARVIHDAADFSRIEQGDVLVTRSTAPYFNVVLPLLGAIVTDRGGQLCHAAIVAREYGIPAVVGTREATRLIPDGARVRVDGTLGEVTLL